MFVCAVFQIANFRENVVCVFVLFFKLLTLERMLYVYLCCISDC